MFMQDLYDKEDPVLSNIMNEKMYKPKDCMSGIFYAVIVKGKLNLNAYITGVNRNRSHLVIVNTFYDRKLSHLVLEEQKEILLATMAVWKTNKATMYVEKSGEKITINFDKKNGKTFCKNWLNGTLLFQKIQKMVKKKKFPKNLFNQFKLKKIKLLKNKKTKAKIKKTTTTKKIKKIIFIPF